VIHKLHHFFHRKTSRLYKLLQIEPSLECMLACVMCPWSEMRPPGACMSWATFTRILPYLPLAEGVDFTGGGEPLRNPLLAEMVQAAKAAGCQAGFSTNGISLTSETAAYLLFGDGQSQARGQLAPTLDWISFSVDAASPALYESIRKGARFDVVIGNIAALHELKQRLGLRAPRMMMVFVLMTGAQQNYHELPAFIDLAHSLGVEQVIAKNLDVILKDGDDQRRLFSHQNAPIKDVQAAIDAAARRAKELGLNLRLYNMQPKEVTICEHNPLQNLFFNWQGLVSPCITLSYAEERVFAGERIHVPCQRFGDINQETLEEIWAKRAYGEFRSCYELRLQAERQAAIDQMLGGQLEEFFLPPAPEGCRTCYYLYGV
jgi:MoaA/NifB/PqqE/SkfB family radical SAM enzyme